MSRIRSLHPGQWTDENFVSCSPFARLLALAIRGECDDQGVFEWKPITIKMRLFPADDVDVSALLAELVDTNQVLAFEHDGKAYGLVRNFRKFQRPQKPNAIFPLPDRHRTYVGIAPVDPVPVQDQSRTGTRIAPQMEDVGDKSKEGSTTVSTVGDPDGSPAPVPAVINDRMPDTPLALQAHHAKTPESMRLLIWNAGLAYLSEGTGKPPAKLRPWLGRLCKRHSDIAVMAALAQAQRDTPANPIAWIERNLNGSRSHDDDLREALADLREGAAG
jgi:hypothetical protein